MYFHDDTKEWNLILLTMADWQPPNWNLSVIFQLKTQTILGVSVFCRTDWRDYWVSEKRMEGGVVQVQQGMQVGQQQGMQGQQPQQQERLNQAVQQQLNLEQVKTRAISLFKAISRILEDFDAYARTNTSPKWQDILGQYSMVNLELFNIVDEIKKVSKAFLVYPRNVNADNATSMSLCLYVY